MLCDLKCELLVTLGDAKIDTEKEKILMEKHNEWENYKVKCYLKSILIYLVISMEFFILSKTHPPHSPSMKKK